MEHDAGIDAQCQGVGEDLFSDPARSCSVPERCTVRDCCYWRSDFLQTPRDVIFPFSPIYGESTGQLDASIFYELTDNIKIGAQGVNLLDEVTRTSQVVDFDGTRITRSAFRNDRRFTFLVRFDF